MRQELREVLGKAVYEALRQGHRQDRVLRPDILPTELPEWEEIVPEWKELNRQRGEAAVQAFIAPMISIIHQVSDKLAERDPEMQGYFEKVMARFEEQVEQSMMQEGRLTGLKNDLLSWAGLHRGKAIAEEAMPRFHEIIDAFEQLLPISKKEGTETHER